MGIFIEDVRQQRAGLFLRDVRYRIYGYFDFINPESRVVKKKSREEEVGTPIRNDETEAKYAAMFQRRASKGQCFHRPYLGCREFACDFKLIEDQGIDKKNPIDITRDLGYMLYDMNFDEDVENPIPLFFKAKMENGTINTDRRQVEVIG